VDDHDRLWQIQSHDLELDPAVVFSDPYETSIELLACPDTNRFCCVDHVHRVRFPDPVASSGAEPPDLAVHKTLL
jgi:hypothetical protein